MDVYASGADAVAVRYALKRAAEEQWSGVVIDVKVAFLNAPLIDEDDGEDPAVVILRPPPLLVKLGFAKPGEHYCADKAIYGLRQSAKRWGDHRDRRLLTMRTASGYIFRPSEAEPNLWRILLVKDNAMSLEEQEIGRQLFGPILIYVDDMLILSVELIVREVIATLQKEWDTPQPEWIEKTSIRFLGMEISLHAGNYLANQKNHIVTDKLDGIDGTGQRATAPVVRDMNPPKEEDIRPELRGAQKAIGQGELLRLSTTRPDIAFVVSKCSQQILAAPRWVMTTSSVVWEYLRGTADFSRRGMNWEEVQQDWRPTRTSPTPMGQCM